MKKLFFSALALLTMGAAMAQSPAIKTNGQINTLMVNNSGDITIRQDVANASSKIIEINDDCRIEDSILMINGHKDCDVVMARLEHLIVNSSGDVMTSGTFRGNDLDVVFNSSGDSKLDLDYDNVYAYMNGSGDLVLRGKCNNLYVETNGSGDVNTKRLEVASKDVLVDDPRLVPNLAGLSELLAELGANLEMLADSVDWNSFSNDMERWGESMEEWGRHMEAWGEEMERRMDGRGNPRGNHEGWDKPQKGPKPDMHHQPERKPYDNYEKRTLLFDGHWNGFDAGLNMLLGPGSAANFEGEYLFLEQRPMKSWVFNFNLADVGIAFGRRHLAGLYTGIGLGWNNFSLNNPVRLFKGENGIEGEWIDESVEGRVKKSKLGVLYVQAPLMLEIRPTRNLFIAAGVTGGVRIDSWTKIKFRDGYKEKHHGDYYVYPFKLDATLRVGGDDMGFFATFDLLPQFDGRNSPDSHTVSFGFSLLF